MNDPRRPRATDVGTGPGLQSTRRLASGPGKKRKPRPGCSSTLCPATSSLLGACAAKAARSVEAYPRPSGDAIARSSQRPSRRRSRLRARGDGSDYPVGNLLRRSEHSPRLHRDASPAWCVRFRAVSVRRRRGEGPLRISLGSGASIVGRTPSQSALRCVPVGKSAASRENLHSRDKAGG